MMDTLEDLPGLKKVKILQSKYQLGADIYEADDRKNTVQCCFTMKWQTSQRYFVEFEGGWNKL